MESLSLVQWCVITALLKNAIWLYWLCNSLHPTSTEFVSIFMQACFNLFKYCFLLMILFNISISVEMNKQSQKVGHILITNACSVSHIWHNLYFNFTSMMTFLCVCVFNLFSFPIFCMHSFPNQLLKQP